MIRRVVLALGIAMSAAAMLSRPAVAHPLGNFTINTSATVTVSPGTLTLTYVVDRAEIPTFQELPSIDTDGDGQASGAELNAWASDEAARVLRGIDVRTATERLPLRAQDATATLAPGQGGLAVLRFEAIYATATAERGTVDLADRNFPGRIGWREIVATGIDGSTIIRSSAPSMSPSDSLRAYPDDLLASPPKQLSASLSFAPGASAPATTPVTVPAPPSNGGGVLGGLLARGDLTLATVGLALLAAIGLGALHAVGPGHGKTLMAAYVVGRDGGARQAVTVGLAVAAMHTSSVLALGMVVLALERLAPERVYPWLTALSGCTALALGVGLLVARIRGTRARSHERDHEQEHDHEHEHSHATAVPGRVMSRRGLAAVAVAGGILPSPTALLALLASFALGRAALGLALVVGFSLGLAATLSLVALAVSRARRVVEARMHGRLTRLLPLASAAVIVAVGATITLRAVLELTG